MNESLQILVTLMDEATAARAHFHTWWALRNLALPDFHKTMNNYEFVDFFHVSNSGHYKLVFVSLAKTFDRSRQAAGIQKLQSELKKEKRHDLADGIARLLTKHHATIEKIQGIRNKSIGHNQYNLPRTKVYKMHGITPNQIRTLIDVLCECLNSITRAFGNTTVISEPERYERATLNMLRQLKNGKT